MKDVVWQFSQDCQCARLSSQWCEYWCYHVAREMSSSPAWSCVWAFSLVSIAMYWSELMVYSGSRKSREINSSLSHKAVHITLTAWGCVLNFFLSREFSCSTSWTLALWTSAYTGDTTPHCWWWRDPGDCRLEPYRGLIVPDEPAYTILSVAVCSFIGGSGRKVGYIPMLTLLFSVHEVQYAAQHSGSCS